MSLEFSTIEFDKITVSCVPESRYAFEFFKTHSPEMVNEMRSFIEHANGSRCFMDVGALYGVFSTVFLAMNQGSKAYAFEPHPDSFRILSDNASLTTGLTPIQKALSAQAGVLPMHEEWGIHYAAGTGILDEGKPNNLEIECIAGDSLCIAPDFIKIDVEGHELSALQGLSQTIQKHHPKILLEIHSRSLAKNGMSSRMVCDFLQELGYTAICTQSKDRISFEEISSIESDSRILFL